MWDITIHLPSDFRAQHPRWHSFISPIDVGPYQIHPPSRRNVLTGTPPRVYSLRGITSLLAHRSVSGSDTICNATGPLLVDIVLFRLSLSGFPSRLYNASDRERFPAFIKGVCSPLKLQLTWNMTVI